jgi:hypothetical protein
MVRKDLRAVKTLSTEEIRLPKDEAERAALIRKILIGWKQDLGIKGVTFGLEFKDFTHNFVELPVTSKADIGNALEFEMENHLPLHPDEYLHDFVTVEAQENKSTNLVVSIRKEKLNWITACMSGTGLRLLGVKCAVVEALNDFLQTEALRNVLFHYSEEHAHYIFGIKERLPSLVKTAYSWTEAVADLKALSEKYGNGIFSSETDDKSALQDLSVKYAAYNLPNLIAVSTLRRTPVDLNFIPEGIEVGKVDYVNRSIAGAAALAVLLLFLTSTLSYFKDYAALKRVNSRIEEIKRTSSELVVAKNELEDIEEKKRFLLQYRTESNTYIQVLTHMSIILPKDAWLTDFSAEEDGKVEIEGYAKRTADLIVPLENSSLLSKVEFSSPVSVRDNMERFSIRMDIER